MDIIATELAACRLGGELNERLEKVFSRLLVLRPTLFNDIVENYGMAEYAANWISTLAMLCEHTQGREEALLKEVSEELLANQQEYGGFAQGQNPETMKIGFWVGDMRGVMGLLDAWRYFDDLRYLHAAQRAVDAMIKYWPVDMKQFAILTWGENPPVKVEIYFALFIPGLVGLYEAIGNEHYLSFARNVFAMMPRLKPGTFPEHADGRMFVLFGAMDLYEATGEKEYLEAVLHDQSVIAEHFQWLSGGIPEIFPDNWRDEACQTANWLRVNLRLWRLTGCDEFLATAERTWRNHLYMNQHPNGGFCWGRTLREGGTLAQRPQIKEDTASYDKKGKPGEPFEMYYCCTETGPRAMLEVGRHGVCKVDGVSAICFWTAGKYELEKSEVTILDDLEPLKSVRVECFLRESGCIKMRIPQYMQLGDMLVDGLKDNSLIDGDWIVVELSAGAHKLLVELKGYFETEDKQYPELGPMTGDVNNNDAAWDKEGVLNFSDKRTAVFFGPWMLKSDVTEDCWFEPNHRYAEALQKKFQTFIGKENHY